MPATEVSTLNIVCDNLACPGNSLPTDERTGWLFVNGEVYGQPTLPQLVVCSPGCLATFTQAAAAREQVKSGLEAWADLPQVDPEAAKSGKAKK